MARLDPDERAKLDAIGIAGPVARTREYRAWEKMVRRCRKPTDPKYAIYGGRGITVCERWAGSFAAFMEDMGPRPSTNHSLDRIDNDGPYSPENCRWATSIEQNSNKRNSALMTIDEVTKTEAEWARSAGISQQLLRYRMSRGMHPKAALSLPVSAAFHPKKRGG